ncbi:serine hydrolase domain-containing protein [Streptomyces sp. DSM 44915]|uniref:Serine hydrolase domain-containing protein n=1 Tax=Streptomyces chisholmiae TaxID=3075540 RepID=A0ABU2K262_9ACTN|nr:serine hydrolase domain-containing protein [Streptomyces sp. DSM 44915]MDT0270518.1 serine hydrolase domain-containing protein [Streptomyces sp. DSM 44915]
MTRCRLTTAVLLASALVGVTVPTATAGGSDRSAAADAVQERLDVLVEEDGVPGVLAHGDAGTRTAGTADLVAQTPMPGADGQVRIASNTKAFTATAVMRLVADGQLRLNDRAGEFVPRLADSTVTVRQLLNQTSGLPEHVQLMDWSAVGTPAEELLALALTQEPAFAPGTDWGYSNTNYLVLGMIIDEVTGEDFRTYVESTILDPLGLDDTYWPEVGELELRGPHARNYGVSPVDPAAGTTDVTELPGYEFGAAGGLVSTPEDLNTFWSALLDDGELLPWWAVWLMTHDTTDVGGRDLYPADTRYGYGLTRYALSCGGSYWGHGGDLPGNTVVGGHSVARDETVTVYGTTVAADPEVRGQLLDVVDAAFCADGR